MFKFILGLLILLPITADAALHRTGDFVHLTGDIDDTLFAAGREVTAEVISSEDLFLAGQRLSLRTWTSENLFVAGGDVAFLSPQARLAMVIGGTVSVRDAGIRDLMVAGGDVMITGSTIEDDMIVGGGRVFVDADTQIQGEVNLAGGTVDFQGVAAKDVVVRAREVFLNGLITGQAEIHADHLSVGPNAVIQGHLAYDAVNVLIDPAARVLGGSDPLTPAEAVGWWPTAFAILSALLFGVGMLLPPAVVSLVAPIWVARGRDLIRDNAFGLLGRGVLTLMLVPFVWFVLFTSVIGIPLGLFMTALAFVIAALSYGIGVFTVADWARRRLRFGPPTTLPLEESAPRRFLWTLATAFFLGLLTAVPVLGFLTVTIVFLMGLGAIVMMALSRFVRPRPRPRESGAEYAMPLKTSPSS